MEFDRTRQLLWSADWKIYENMRLSADLNDHGSLEILACHHDARLEHNLLRIQLQQVRFYQQRSECLSPACLFSHEAKRAAALLRAASMQA